MNPKSLVLQASHVPPRGLSGIVKLTSLPRDQGDLPGVELAFSPSDNLDPSCEGPTTKQAVVPRSRSVPTHVEEIANNTMYRQEALRLSNGLELAHLAFPLLGRLMRHFREVVRIAPGVVDDGRHDRAARCSVASQLVGDEAARLPTLALQQLAEESPCGRGVSSALDEDVEDITILVNGSPQVVSVASDGDEDLVKEPGVSESTLPPP